MEITKNDAQKARKILKEYKGAAPRHLRAQPTQGDRPGPLLGLQKLHRLLDVRKQELRTLEA